MSELTPDLIREFVIAAHFNLAKVQELHTQHPELLTVKNQWSENDFEDGLGAAAHVGNRAIAAFFLERGVRSNICVAAMLGNTDEVQAFLDSDASLANARGAHGITLMFHAAMSGDTALTQRLKDAGCTEGYTHALFGAINHQHKDMVAWLLANGANPTEGKNHEGKTPLQVAITSDQAAIADLLRQHGAQE